MLCYHEQNKTLYSIQNLREKIYKTHCFNGTKRLIPLVKINCNSLQNV